MLFVQKVGHVVQMGWINQRWVVLHQPKRCWGGAGDANGLEQPKMGPSPFKQVLRRVVTLLPDQLSKIKY